MRKELTLQWISTIQLTLLQGCQVNDVVYFGSYGSGATCISGLLKFKKGFKKIVNQSPQINDFINNKELKTIQEYEQIKAGESSLKTVLGKIVEHEKNNNRGFTLHFCDEGCILPNIVGLNHCPKGHTGFHEKFFPLYAVLKSEPIVNPNENKLNYLYNGLVRIAGNVKEGSCLEYEIRRLENKEETNFNAIGLLNWSPMYYPVQNIY